MSELEVRLVKCADVSFEEVDGEPRLIVRGVPIKGCRCVSGVEGDVVTHIPVTSLDAGDTAALPVRGVQLSVVAGGIQDPEGRILRDIAILLLREYPDLDQVIGFFQNRGERDGREHFTCGFLFQPSKRLPR